MLAVAATCTLAVAVNAPLERLDGNIPIGRLKRPGPSVDALVTAQLSDGRVQTTRTSSNGTFYFDRMPNGPTTLTVTPMDTEYETQSFVVVMGEEQSNVIVVSPVPKERPTDIEGLDLEPTEDPGARKGRPVSVRTKVRGPNRKNLNPTLWVDGGIGSLTPSGNLMPTQGGQGTLHAELYGFSKAVTVTVTDDRQGR